MSKHAPTLPLSRAIVLIFLSVIVITGPALLGLLYYQGLQKQRSHDDRYHITTLIPSCLQRTKLPHDYLCEFLNLSHDKPTNLFQVNRQEYEKRLLQSPLIKDAHVTKSLPNKLIVDYTLRRPIALLDDFENTALDSEGYLFPYSPFFPTQKLPHVYLGLSSFQNWSLPYNDPNYRLAMDIYTILGKHLCSSTLRLRKIDVSHAFATSYGKREIIVDVEEQQFNGSDLHQCITTLRLSTERYSQELANFQSFRDHHTLAGEKKRILDLRLPHIGYLKVIE